MKLLRVVLLFLFYSNHLFAQSDFRLIGTTYSDGGKGAGAVFIVNPDGSDLAKLKSFESPVAETPTGGLIKDTENNLYGVTISGGQHGSGTIFKITSDGQFMKLFDFERFTSGRFPEAALTLASNGDLYGSTYSGGTHDFGTIFKIKKDGSGFTRLFDFEGLTKGQGSFAGLTECSNGYLYGLTIGGGEYNSGFIYRIKLDGSGFEKVRDFKQGDPRFLYGKLVEASNGKLYGATRPGIFKINKDGTDFLKISNVQTNGPLVQGADNFFYGIDFNGVVFKMDENGNNYTSLTSAIGTAQGGLTLSSDGFLYGATSTKGVNSKGVFFRIKPDGSDFSTLLDFSADTGDNQDFFGNNLLELSTGIFAGTAIQGGLGDHGVIYKITSQGVFSKIKEFSSGPMSPRSEVLVGSDGYFYGITQLGGSKGQGTVYKVKPNGTEFTVLLEFDEVNTGSSPSEKLIQDSQGNIFGLANYGGSKKGGLIFSIQPDGSSYRKVYEFDGSASVNVEGFSPGSSLLLTSNGYLYGITYNGGAKGYGTIFKMKKDGSSFSKLYDFESFGYNYLTLSDDGYLYVTSTNAGANGFGSIFKIDTDGNSFQKLFDFETGTGVAPRTNLTIGSNDYLYGTTNYGGSFGFGTIFRLRKDGSDFSKLFDFNGDNGANVFRAPLVEGPDKFLYGVTQKGGLKNGGSLFKIKLDGSSFMKIVDFNSSTGYAPVGGLIVITDFDKVEQTITFNSIPPKTYGDASFDLRASSTSDLMLKYFSASDKITIVDSRVTLNNPGKVVVKASQPGNTNYNAAPEIEQSFCINPVKPIIASTNLNAAEVTLTSNSTGNQWYLNDKAIEGATNVSFNVTQSGSYTVKSTVDNCSSEISDATDLIITGIEDQRNSISVYPNPVNEEMRIDLSEISGDAKISVYDMLGRRKELIIGYGNRSVSVNTSQYNAGNYILQIIYDKGVFQKQFIKN